MRIAVIGCGPAGIVALHTIQKRLVGKVPNLEVVAYERGKDFGGQWIFSEGPNGNDELGNPLRSAMYRGLICNTPNLLMQIHPDFPIPEGSPLYMTREQYLDYIRNAAESQNLRKYCQFSSLVTMVKRDDSGNGFIIDVTNLEDESKKSENFDYVLFCAGQHRQPKIPGVDTSGFTGDVLHYHALKDPSRFYGKRILVVGTSFAGMDMAIMLARKTEKMIFSWHIVKQHTFWVDSAKILTLKPNFIKASGNKAFFTDGTSEEVDVIIYATAFTQSHPLSPELHLDFNNPDNEACLYPLYKHVIHPSCPKLFFMAKAYINIIGLMRIHAELACGVISGDISLPSENEMLADIKNFQDRWIPQISAFNKSGDIAKFYPNMELEFEMADQAAELAKCDSLLPFASAMWYNVIRNMRDDILNYKWYKLVVPPNLNPPDGEYFGKP